MIKLLTTTALTAILATTVMAREVKPTAVCGPKEVKETIELDDGRAETLCVTPVIETDPTNDDDREVPRDSGDDGEYHPFLSYPYPADFVPNYLINELGEGEPENGIYTYSGHDEWDHPENMVLDDDSETWEMNDGTWTLLSAVYNGEEYTFE